MTLGGAAVSEIDVFQARIGELSENEVEALGRAHIRLIPGRFETFDLRFEAEAAAERAGMLDALWDAESAAKETFLEREAELGIEFDATTGERREALRWAYEAVQRAAIAIASGQVIDSALSDRLLAPWRTTIA